MLARVHRSTTKLNLGSDLQQFEQELPQLKLLSCLFLVHLEQLLAILGVQQPPVVQHPTQQGQPEVPVVQG
jgi:hypothetical protein